jgi:plastocyanin
MSGSSRTPLTIAWLAVAAAIFLLASTLIMGVAMATFMDGGMMHRRGNNGPQAPVVATGSEALVEIRDFDYFPRDLTITTGSTVKWTNYDSAPHTATDKDGAWDTDRLDKNESATLTFDDPGQYDYYCVYHPYMEATLTVR